MPMMTHSKRKMVHLMAGVIFISAVGIFLCLAHYYKKNHRVTSQSIKSNRLVLGPESEQCNRAVYEMMIYGSQFGFYSLTEEGKQSIFKLVSKIQGEGVQILRFSCWLNESSSNIRRIILQQWLGQMKYENRLPPLNFVVEKVRPWLKSLKDSEIKARLEEISDVYINLNIPDPYKQKDYDLFWGFEALERLKPFIDRGLPLGSVLFSGNKDMIKSLFDAHIKKYGYDLGNEGDIFQNTVRSYLGNGTGNN